MMDFWKYLSEGKGVLLSEELDFPVDGHGSCKNKVMECEIKPFSDVENYPLVSNTQALEGLNLMDLGFSDEIRRSYSMSSEPSGEVFSDEIGTSYGNVVSPFCEEKELGSRISIDFVQSNNQDFSLIDLKLGRLADGGRFCAKDDEFSNVGVPAPSSIVSSPPAKRARSTTLYPRPPCCQVLGCNKDLSSCKGYYKRHKVCDVHTKTAKVIVDGIEQRFCQQCSRFHLVAEFDDGKRSCRRRLAAHNKRRRKPQLTSESGTTVIGFSSPFGFRKMLPSAVVDTGEERSNMVGGVKDNIVALQRLSDIQTSRALSLLSTRSHNLSSQLLEAATLTPLMNQSIHADSERIAHNPFHAPATAMYSVGSDHVKTTTTDHRDGDDAISRVPDLRNVTTNYHYNELGHGAMLDLFQLSSHLQRIEQQRHSTESEAG